MFIIGIISELLLYLCFGLLTGAFLLYAVPERSRPELHIPKGFVMAGSAGVIIFSFIPVLKLLLDLVPMMGMAQTLVTVLFTFEVGKSWIFTFLLADLLFVFVIWFDYRKQAVYAWIGMFFTFALILALAWASHASSYNHVTGFLSHTVHFTAVSVWTGILFCAAWFSKKQTNWLNFLKWFTPAALVCFLTVTGSGLLLMTFVVEYKNYANSWMVPYGQSLLLKHLFILPLFVFAVINSRFVKKRTAADPAYDPRPWARAESLIILFLFSATAALGQQSPPHETIVTNDSVSKIFTLLYQGTFEPGMAVHLSWNMNSLSLLVLAVLFLLLMIVSFVKKAPAILSFLMGVLLVLSGYLALMLGIQ